MREEGDDVIRLLRVTGTIQSLFDVCGSICRVPTAAFVANCSELLHSGCTQILRFCEATALTRTRVCACKMAILIEKLPPVASVEQVDFPRDHTRKVVRNPEAAQRQSLDSISQLLLLAYRLEVHHAHAATHVKRGVLIDGCGQPLPRGIVEA